MRVVNRCLPLLFIFSITPVVIASDRDELDQRYNEAVTAAASLAGPTTGTPSEARSRESLLRDLLDDAPDYAPARAELGEVLVEGRWLPVDYAQHLAAEDPDLKAYEALRASAEDTLAEHTRLARWCEKRGLIDEARPHWLAVLANSPRHVVALKALSAVWSDGKLWDAGLAEEAGAKARSQRRRAAEWEKRLRRLESDRSISAQEIASLREDLDTAAIGPIEARLESLLKPNTQARAARTRLLTAAWFEAVDRLDEVEVTASLCRVAVFGSEEDRRIAINHLEDRPQFDTMPLLLSALKPPIDSHAKITRQANGTVVYEHRLGRQGENVHEKHRRVWSASVAVVPNRQSTRFLSPSEEVNARTNAFLDAQYATLWQEAAFRLRADQLDTEVANHNARTNELNRRVFPALRAVSDEDHGDDPVDWWKHWQEHSGYDRYAPRVERTYDFDNKNYYVEGPPPPPRCECFIAGTPVWTRTGKSRIEAIKAGDLVLARDPHRGGLTYRAVLDTTVREPSPMVTLEISRGEKSEKIHATVGHPFWVLGEGWRMAKNLEPGDLVSTVNGPSEIASNREAPQRKAYNLIVEGAANYYVGETGVLVHDNTPRRPAVGLVARR